MAHANIQVARQRYETAVARDEEGKPLRTQVMNTDGSPKLTRRGQPIYRTQTTVDKSKPLPPRRCERCGSDLVIGEKYRSIAVKHARGGTVRYRCMECPTWQPWEVSNSLSARIQQIQHDASLDLDNADDQDGLVEARDNAATAIRELAEEKREAAQNIEDGFQHATYQSDELNDTADQLESWADEVESADVDDEPDPEDVPCEACSGGGKIPDGDEDIDCPECEGSGDITPDELSEEEREEWLSEQRDNILQIIENSPV